jgi:hypothetical protein
MAEKLIDSMRGEGIVNLKTIPDRRLTSEENGASLGG